MAELTALESKIGEVLGLAMAAQGATRQVGKLVAKEGEHDDLKQALEQMHEEAKEAEKRSLRRSDAGSDSRGTTWAPGPRSGRAPRTRRETRRGGVRS